MQASLNSIFSWGAVTSATKYHWQLLNAAGGAVLQEGDVTGTSVTGATVFAAQPAGNYNFQVRAETATLQGPYSPLLPIEYFPLAAPPNVSVTP